MLRAAGLTVNMGGDDKTVASMLLRNVAESARL